MNKQCVRRAGQIRIAKWHFGSVNIKEKVLKLQVWHDPHRKKTESVEKLKLHTQEKVWKNSWKWGTCKQDGRSKQAILKPRGWEHEINNSWLHEAFNLSLSFLFVTWLAGNRCNLFKTISKCSFRKLNLSCDKAARLLRTLGCVWWAEANICNIFIILVLNGYTDHFLIIVTE